MFNLKKQLKNYEPYDEKEKFSVQKTIEFLNSNSNCYSRTNLEGHITAGGFVCHEDGRILLNHHKITDMWFQFGGHSDGNENSFEVAKREIFEESGINTFVLSSENIFDVNHEHIDARPSKNEPEHYHYDINFFFVTNQDHFKISDESSGIKWVSLDEAKKLVSVEDHGMQRMLKKYEKYLKNRKN